jgi:hypothetical protein
MELKRDKPLFNELLTFTLTDESNNLTDTDLVFRIISGSQPSTIPGSSESLFYFELTDERDPYFLYYFVLSDHDYPIYKREQEINVDFHDCPGQIIKLLRSCMLKSASLNSSKGHSEMKSDPSNGGNSSSDSTHMAKLNLKDGLLSIVECKHFKQTKQIDIPLTLGDDRAIKMYLASSRKLIQDMNNRNKQELEHTKELLKEEENARKKLDHDFAELRLLREADIQTLKATYSLEKSELSTEHSNELNRMREKNSQLIDGIKSQHEKELTELNSSIKHLEKKYQGWFLYFFIFRRFISFAIHRIGSSTCFYSIIVKRRRAEIFNS